MDWWQSPWSFHKVVVSAEVVLAGLVLYTVLHINWVYEISHVPGRIWAAWKESRGYLGMGLASGCGGILLARYAYHGLESGEINKFAGEFMLIGAAGMVMTSALFLIGGTLGMLFSPLRREKPDSLGPDLVTGQKAYGDARAANAAEVDAALRGGGSRKREFKD
jgi:hypothetical protein